MAIRGVAKRTCDGAPVSGLVVGLRDSKRYDLDADKTDAEGRFELHFHDRSTYALPLFITDLKRYLRVPAYDKGEFRTSVVYDDEFTGVFPVDCDAPARNSGSEDAPSRRPSENLVPH